jgi:hypothetical protein
MFEDLNYEELKRRANARLPERVVATLEARGERRSAAEGELLYGVDDRQYPFVYAISATLQIRDPDGLVLGVMEPGQFTGELSLLFGQTAFADCITVKAGEVLLVPGAITELVQVDPEVSDSVTRARLPCSEYSSTPSATASRIGGWTPPTAPPARISPQNVDTGLRSACGSRNRPPVLPSQPARACSGRGGAPTPWAHRARRGPWV